MFVRNCYMCVLIYACVRLCVCSCTYVSVRVRSVSVLLWLISSGSVFLYIFELLPPSPTIDLF